MLSYCGILHIILRDHLRSNAEDRRKYGELKKELAVKYPNDIDLYVEEKTSFILDILKKYEIKENELSDIDNVNKKK